MDAFLAFVVVAVFVRPVARLVGRNPEDGSEVVRDFFLVVAENARGARVAHDRLFADEAEAEAFADRVYEAVVGGGRKLSAAHWSETDPCYGSEAYVEAEPEIVAHERAVEKDAARYA